VRSATPPRTDLAVEPLTLDGAAPRAALTRASILLVDDRPENLLALEAILAPLGQELVQARSGPEALKRLLAHDFAVVLLDVQMPGMDGFQTAEYIKRRERTRHLPIIFLTAISKDPQHVLQGYSSGAVDYLAKPFDPPVLRSKVAVFVDLHRKERALQASEERFRTAFHGAPIGIGLLGLDGTWLQVNESLSRMTGYPRGRLRGRPLDELWHDGDPPVQLDCLPGVLDDGVHSQRLETRYVRLDGTVGWALVSISVVRDAQRRPAHFIVQMEDVTDRKRAELELARRNRSALQASEERFRTAFHGAPIGIGLVDLDGRWLEVNPALSEMTGHARDGLLGRPLEELVHPDDPSPRFHSLQTMLEHELPSRRVEGRYLRASGEAGWALVSVSLVRDAERRPAHFIVQMEDISERKHAELELAHRALHDPLTELPNRALFLDRVEHAVARLQRAQARLALLFLDLDRFKLINDSLGHDCGDELLVQAADRLRGLLRPRDTVARLGGDEFTVLCEDIADERHAVEIAERIAESLAAPFALSGGEAFVTASIGIVVCDDPEARAEDLIRDADAAMYRAKARGRSLWELFDEDVRARVTQRLEVKNALHRAIERGELELYYQPTVSLATGEIEGAEALLRWNHPELGVVPPIDFIPLAEETGLILQIGQWVLEQACAQAAHWQAERPERAFVMALNLSPRQLAQPDLPQLVGGAVAASGIDPGQLCLEITESVLVHDFAAAVAALRELKELGVRLAVDDFGTGYSSLTYLKGFPVDVLKIDRSFVAGVGRDAEDAPIVSAVVGLARALGMTTVAEGVETPEQLFEVRRLGCASAQGYYFARPRPRAGFEELLAGGLPVPAG